MRVVCQVNQIKIILAKRNILNCTTIELISKSTSWWISTCAPFWVTASPSFWVTAFSSFWVTACSSFWVTRIIWITQCKLTIRTTITKSSTNAWSGSKFRNQTYCCYNIIKRSKKIGWNR